MITQIEDFFTQGCGRCERFATPDCSTRHWAAGLRELRRICLAARLEETVKWGHPCYMHAGPNTRHADIIQCANNSSWNFPPS